MKGKRINLAAPHLFGREQEYLSEAIASNWIAPLGPFVNKSEEMVEAMTGRPCAAVSTGTAALHLAMVQLGVGPGDIVFCSDMTFAASVNPAIYQGAKPVFIDSEDRTYNMDPLALEMAFAKYPNPKVVIVTHLYGTPADYEIFEICKNHGVPVVEDAAEVMGATINGKWAGAIGDIGIYSFNGNKIVTGSNGGMVICLDEKTKQHIVNLSTQAKVGERYEYLHTEIGYNYRMSNITAAILCGQMENLDEKICMKKVIHDRYFDRLNGYLGCQILNVPEDRTGNYWLTILKTSDASGTLVKYIIKKLEENNIQSRRVWTPLHQQPVNSGMEVISCAGDGPMTNADDFFNRALCLPSDTNMTASEQCDVIDIIEDAIFEFRFGFPSVQKTQKYVNAEADDHV